MIKIKGAMLIRLMQMIFWTFNNTSVLKWKANKQNWPISVSSFHLFSYSLIQFRVLMFSIPFHVSCVHVSVLMPFWLLPISHLCLMISHSCVCKYRNVFPFVLCLQSAELLCFCSFVCASPWWILSSFCMFWTPVSCSVVDFVKVLIFATSKWRAYVLFTLLASVSCM